MKLSTVVTSVGSICLLGLGLLGAYGAGSQQRLREELSTSASIAHSLYELKAAAELNTSDKQGKVAVNIADDALARLSESARELGAEGTVYGSNSGTPATENLSQQLEQSTQEIFESFVSATSEDDRAIALSIAQGLWAFQYDLNQQDSLPSFISGSNSPASCRSADSREEAPQAVNDLTILVNAYLYTAQVYDARSDIEGWSSSTTTAISRSITEAQTWQMQLTDAVTCTYQKAPGSASYAIDESDPAASLEKLRSGVLIQANATLANPEIPSDTELFQALLKLTFTPQNISER